MTLLPNCYAWLCYHACNHALLTRDVVLNKHYSTHLCREGEFQLLLRYINFPRPAVASEHSANKPDCSTLKRLAFSLLPLLSAGAQQHLQASSSHRHTACTKVLFVCTKVLYHCERKEACLLYAISIHAVVTIRYFYTRTKILGHSGLLIIFTLGGWQY